MFGLAQQIFSVKFYAKNIVRGLKHTEQGQYFIFFHQQSYFLILVDVYINLLFSFSTNVHSVFPSTARENTLHCRRQIQGKYMYILFRAINGVVFH